MLSARHFAAAAGGWGRASTGGEDDCNPSGRRDWRMSRCGGYDTGVFGKTVERFGKVLIFSDMSRPIGFVVSQPAHLHELTDLPVGQDYP